MSVKVAIDLSDNNIWDDSLLIKAYDESKKLASADVAKRIAHLTNKKCGVDYDEVVNNNSTEIGSESEESATSADEKTAPQATNQSANNYKIGDHVRCTFSEDGKDYEAKIISFPTEHTVLIRYLGYNNEEIVDISAIVRTWGKQYRKQQIAAAKIDMATAVQPKQIIVDSQQFRQDGKKRRINKKNQNGISPCESYQSLNKNLIPPPPQPPMPPMLADMCEESEHLSAMLMSWYMSGYYTGLYQGIKQNKSHKSPDSPSTAAAAASSSSSSKKRGNGKR